MTDATAKRLIPKDTPLVCQPPDAGRLRGDGFTDVRPVEDELARAEAPEGSGHGEK